MSSTFSRDQQHVLAEWLYSHMKRLTTLTAQAMDASDEEAVAELKAQATQLLHMITSMSALLYGETLNEAYEKFDAKQYDRACKKAMKFAAMAGMDASVVQSYMRRFPDGIPGFGRRKMQ